MKVTNCVLVSDNIQINDAAIEFSDKIENITNGTDRTGIDLNGMYVFPGIIDTHIHGVNGYDFSDLTMDSIVEMEKFLYTKGVTSFLPTTVSLPFEQVIQALELARKYKKENPETSVEGVHIEGPFINVNKKGAQNPDYIFSPEEYQIDELLKYKDIIKIITVAPEIENIDMLIERFSMNGIGVSIGHTLANHSQCMHALEKGATRFTHLFNAMNGIHHQDVGCAGAGLLSDAYVEVIADLVHLSPEAIKLIFNLKKNDKIILISDSIRANGLKDGKYTLGNLEVTVSEGVARLNDGALAGSTANVIDGLRNILKVTEKSLINAVACATSNPGKSIKINKGILNIGNDADFVVMDRNMELKATVKKGKIIYGSL